MKLLISTYLCNINSTTPDLQQDEEIFTFSILCIKIQFL